MNISEKNKSDGVILLFLSENNDRSQTFMYKLNDSLSEVAYPGCQTNDATVRYLISKANSDHHDISQIICIQTKECKSIPHKTDYDEEITSWERFNRMVKDYCSENNFIIPKITPIDYNFDEHHLRIYQKVTEVMNREELHHFYLDFSGGFRDISYLFTMIVQNLQFNGAECSSIVYAGKTKTSDNKTLTSIKDIGNIYNMSKILEACDTFINTGYSQQLTNVFDRLVKKSDHSDYKAISNLVYSIKDFTDTVSLCDINRLESVTENLSKAVLNAEKTEASSDLYLEMFRSLIPTIKESMIPNRDSRMTIKDTIKWCIDKRMIQQALTIFTEKMADYYFDKHVCDDVKELELPTILEANFSSPKAQAFYLELFNDVSFPDPSCKLGARIFSLWGEYKENTTDKVQIFIKKVENERNEQKDDLSKQALENFISYVKDHYDISSWTSKKQVPIKKSISTSDFYGCFKDIDETDVKFTKFIGEVKNKPSAIMHYFMYADEDAYTILKDKYSEYENYFIKNGENVDKQEANILKKLGACLNLECGTLPENIKKNLNRFSLEEQIKKRAYVADVMRCYALIKFIRNHTNHAAGNGENIIEKAFLDYFSKGTFLDKESPCSKLERIIDEFENNKSRLNADNILKVLNYALNLA